MANRRGGGDNNGRSRGEVAERRGRSRSGRNHLREGAHTYWNTDMRARCRWEANGADADEVERKDEVWQLESRASAPFQRGRPGSGSEAECEHTGTHLV